MKKEIIQFRITKKLKDKLITDSIINGFPNMTAYLTKLIESGLATSGTLDMKLNLIDQKMGTLPGDIYIMLKNLSHEIAIAQNDFDRRTYVTFRMVSVILARTFLMKEDEITNVEIERANEFLNNEIKNFEKNYSIK